MSSQDERLFSELDLRSVLEGNCRRARQAVEDIPESKFSAATDEELREHVVASHQVMPLQLHDERMTMESAEIQVDVRHDHRRAVFDRDEPALVPGVAITVDVPFTGDSALWKCQPNTFTLNPPRACICTHRDKHSGTLVLQYLRPSDDVNGDELKRGIDNALKSIREYLERINKQVADHNSQLPAEIANAVACRRERLGKHAQIAKTLAIPMKQKPGSADFTPVPVKRRIVKPLPSAANRPAEPGIREEDYSFILNVIRHEGRSFEATPRTFAVHGEEQLRDIILAHLNGHFEGDATGEAFRKRGKTDIRIEDKNRAAFVGECKVWRGAKEATKAVDQLLSYLTWRDCKAALILFNRDTAGFAALQAKLPEVLAGHAKCIRTIEAGQVGEWRFVFRSADDDERHVTIHVFLFNLFVAAEGSPLR
jgi:hypothetical protein